MTRERKRLIPLVAALALVATANAVVVLAWHSKTIASRRWRGPEFHFCRTDGCPVCGDESPVPPWEWTSDEWLDLSPLARAR